MFLYCRTDSCGRRFIRIGRGVELAVPLDKRCTVCWSHEARKGNPHSANGFRNGGRRISALAINGFQVLHRQFRRRHGRAYNALGLPASGEMHRTWILHCDFNIPVQSPVPHVQLLLLGTWRPCLLQGGSEDCQMDKEPTHLLYARTRNGSTTVSAQDAKKPRLVRPNGTFSCATIATLRYIFSMSLRKRSLMRSSSSLSPCDSTYAINPSKRWICLM